MRFLVLAVLLGGLVVVGSPTPVPEEVLRQAIAEQRPLLVTVRATPWTPELVTAFFAGLVMLTYAVAKVYGLVRSSRNEGREAGVRRDEKLDQIASNVDGNLSKALEKIDSLEQQNALLIRMLSSLAAKADQPGEVAKVVEQATAADPKMAQE